MSRYRFIGSYGFEVEAPDEDSAYDIWYEQIAKKCFWENMSEWGEVDDENRFKDS